ncbi:MAG: hypothetical protein Q9169_007481 [Polycauliona sp. 2 TL-2023]
MNTPRDSHGELAAPSIEKPPADQTEETALGPYPKPLSPLDINMPVFYDPATWMHFRNIHTIVDRHQEPCRSLRALLKRRFFLAHYHSRRLEKRAEVIRSIAYSSFMAPIEDVRVKMDVCLNKIWLASDRAEFIKEEVDDLVHYRYDFAGGKIKQEEVERVLRGMGQFFTSGAKSFDGDEWKKMAQGSKILAEMLSRLTDAEWREKMREMTELSPLKISG